MNKFKRKVSIISIISIIGISFLLGIIYWNSFNMPWERDEGEYAYSAWLLDQGIPPYENSFLQKPPMIIYTYWLAQKINPNALWPPKMLSFISTILTIYLLYLIAKKCYGKKAGLIAAWIAVPMLSLPHITALQANTEKFMLLFLTATLALYIYHKNSEKTYPWILAGASAAISLLYKPIALLPLIFIFIVWLWKYYSEKNELKKLLTKALLIFTGGTSTTLLVISYFLITNSFSYLWEFVIIFNSYYVAQMGQYLSWAPLKYLNVFWSNWWLLFFITAYSIIARTKKLWFYIILMILSVASVISSPIGHYYLLLMPFWILIITGGISKFLNLTIIQSLQIDWKKLVIFLTMTIVMISLLWPIQQEFFLSPKNLNLWIYGYNEPFLESKIVADKIIKKTFSEDKIFVAASEPQIYYYSKRLSVSRFIITFALLIDTPFRDKHQQQAIDDIKNDKPKIIIYSQLPNGGLWEKGVPTTFIDYLNNLINNEYELIGGFVRDKDQYGHWQEPINSQEEFNASSLLMYKLNDK